MRLQRFFDRPRADGAQPRNRGGWLGAVQNPVREEVSLWQPQDGATKSCDGDRVADAVVVQEIDARRLRPVGNEPEDAHITGTTRSLSRRVMGLNVTAPTRPEGKRPAVRGKNAAAEKPQAQVA